MAEIGDELVEIQHFLMDGTEQKVTVPDGTTLMKFNVTVQIVNRYYLTGETTLVWPMPIGHFEAIQERNWANKDFYLEGVAGGVVKIEFIKGLMS